MYDIKEIKTYLASLISHVTFEYKGLNCGIDPFNMSRFEMWYGQKSVTMTSIEDVMTSKFFDGKSLEEIWDDVVDLEY